MVSYLIAPVGIAAASLELWRTKHRGGEAPARTVAPLAVNAVFLLVAVVLGWLLLEAIKR
jgi:hypothetical protein